MQQESFEEAVHPEHALPPEPDTIEPDTIEPADPTATTAAGHSEADEPLAPVRPQHASLADDLVGGPEDTPHGYPTPDDTTDTMPDEGALPEGLLLRARGLEFSGRESNVFGPLDFDLPKDTLGMIVGQQGTGRSAILLALAGRLKGVKGGLQVDEIDAIAHPRLLRKQVSVARITGLADLEPNLTISESRDERAIAEGIGTRRGRERFTHLEALLDHRFDLDMWVDRMPAVERTLLTVVLGCLAPARFVVLDDIDDSLTEQQTLGIQEALQLLVADGNQFIVTALEESPVPEGAAVLHLPPPAQREDSTLLLRFPSRRAAFAHTSRSGSTVAGSARTETISEVF